MEYEKKRKKEIILQISLIVITLIIFILNIKGIILDSTDLFWFLTGISWGISIKNIFFK